MKPCGVRILGTGSAVPEYILNNDELSKEHGVDAAWIEQRTGIESAAMTKAPSNCNAKH